MKIFSQIVCTCGCKCCIINFMVKITISENEAGQRLDRFLRKYFRRASLGTIYKLLRKDVKLNGRRAKEDVMLAAGDRLDVYISEERLKELTEAREKQPVRHRFKIAYEDNNILIAEKPKGLLTHGDAHEKKNTLVNQVCGYLQEKGEYIPSRERTFTPAPVNRLDRNTTGLVIFGKNAAALRSFTRLIRERDSIGKYYLTVLCGVLEHPLFLEDRLVKDEERNISRAAEGEEGKAAATYVKPLHHSQGFTLAEARIFTGRTHQIRVHLADAGFPLAGDAKYGRQHINAQMKRLGLTTQLLHAYRLRFAEMPEEYARLSGRTVEATLPADFSKLIEALKLSQKDMGKGTNHVQI